MSEVYVMVDHIGRRFIGVVEGDANEPIVILKDPLIMNEKVDPRAGSVSLTYSPVFHTFEVDEITVKWTTKFPAKKILAEDYQKYVNAIRVKRHSNIDIVPGMPANLPQVGG